MIDLRIIEIRDTLPVTAIGVAENVSPPSISIVGRNFQSAYEVLINDEVSPSIYVVSSNALLAQIPTSQLNTYINQVVVISNRLTRNAESHKIVFRLGNVSHSVQGITKLIQSFVKILLQTPGTDIFSKNIGGGIIRAVYGYQNDIRNLSSDLQVAVNRTRQQLLAIQSGDKNLLPQEKLLYAELIDTQISRAENTVTGKIRLGSHAMQDTTFNLGL
jgi:hypothetical protein